MKLKVYYNVCIDVDATKELIDELVKAHTGYEISKALDEIQTLCIKENLALKEFTKFAIIDEIYLDDEDRKIY